MPQLGLSLSTDSSSASRIEYALGDLGFPTRIKITSSSLAFTDNLLKVEDVADGVTYEGSEGTLFFGKTSQNSFAEITSGGTSSSYPSWTAGATTIPRTGWQNGFVVSEVTPLSLTITASTPQTFTYNASTPTIVFSNDQGVASNLFLFTPTLSAPSGTRSTTISLILNADYVGTNEPSVSYTINKKNVTISLTSQSSTYAPNQTYSEVTPVAITSLSGADTISGSFASLLTGMPTTGANAGSYTLAFNPSYTSTNYNITNSPTSVTWTISKANQTITFNPTLTGTSGQTQSLSASSTSGLSVAFSVVSGPATLAGSVLTYTGSGNVVVRASQAGNTNYNVATNVDKTIVVTSAASFPDVAGTTSVLFAGIGGYNKTTSALYGYTFSGSGNIYYLFESYDENFSESGWVMFSGSTQTVTTLSGASINLLANKWYVLGGMNTYSNNAFSIYISSTNTTATQTSATIPLVNWDNNYVNNNITDYTNG